MQTEEKSISVETSQQERKIWVDRFTVAGQMYVRLRFQYTSINFTACSLITTFYEKLGANKYSVVSVLIAFAFASWLLIYQLNKSIIYTNKSISILRKKSSVILPELEKVAELRRATFSGCFIKKQTLSWTLINTAYPIFCGILIFLSST